MNFTSWGNYWRLVSSKPLVTYVSIHFDNELDLFGILLEVSFIQAPGEFGIHPLRKKKVKVHFENEH